MSESYMDDDDELITPKEVSEINLKKLLFK